MPLLFTSQGDRCTIAQQERSVPTGSSEQERIGREFDEDACDFCDRYKKRGLSSSSKLLLDFIVGERVQGRSVVDLGCGAGGFSVQLLKEGAASANGFDLSQNMVNTAMALARAEGFEGKAKFQLGNAATAKLPPSDIVIMDKVLCCYPDWKLLLKNAAGASQTMLGFVVPRDIGIARLPFRAGIRLVNFFAKRRGSILFYLHPLGLIDSALRDSGFIQQRKRTSRLWLVFLYTRSAGVGTNEQSQYIAPSSSA